MNTFLQSSTNRRTDQYGGSVENRSWRLLTVSRMSGRRPISVCASLPTVLIPVWAAPTTLRVHVHGLAARQTRHRVHCDP
jgi:hypothetical protein